MSKLTKDIASSPDEELDRHVYGKSYKSYGSEGYTNPVSEQTPNNEMVTSWEATKQKEAILSGNGPHNKKDPQLWRDLTAYWILGLCNNYGYVVMLSAAHDIIEQFSNPRHTDDAGDGVATDSGRHCNIASTGTILLADIIPALFVKVTAPFIPFWVNVRVFLAITLAAGGFLLVAFAQTSWVAVVGVVFTSASSGIGETTLLAYSSRFNKNVISTWSSGTGGAGVIGSLSYAALKSLKIGPVTTMLIMLIVPVIESFTFWILLRRPAIPTSHGFGSTETELEEIHDDEKPLMTMCEKLRYVVYLMRYMMPLTLVYLFEYFINQGLFELVYFEDAFLDKQAQYRWLNVDYQIGVFISRSSVNLFTVEKVWIMSILQLVNVVYFVIEVVFYVTPSIWIVFLIVLWEGLLGGGAYVNTFYRMSKEISPVRRVFAMGIVAQADSFGIAVAGFLAIPIHNLICGLPAPIRSLTF